MNLRKTTIVTLLAVATALVAWIGMTMWKQRQWFDLQEGQLATIKQLEEFPPGGSSEAAWRNALVTPYNVWGNVTYSPDYSNISIEEMRSLQSQLDRILAETTSENSIESVDRVFELLMQRGRKTEFINGYLEEFRAYYERNGQ